MVLINAARRRAGGFWLPGYSPAPPLAFNTNLGYSARAHSQSILNAGGAVWSLRFRQSLPRGKGRRGWVSRRKCAGKSLQGATGPEFMESANQGFMDSEGIVQISWNLATPSLLLATRRQTKRRRRCRGPARLPKSSVGVRRGGTARDSYGSGCPLFSHTRLNLRCSRTPWRFTPLTAQRLAVAQVVIDGVAHPLKLSTDADGMARIGL